MHAERYLLRLIAGIAETINAGKIHLIRAVPKQPLLAVIKPQRRVRAGLFQRQCDPGLLLHGANGSRSVLRRSYLLLRNNLVTGGRRRLLLGRSPSRRHAAFQLLIAVIRAVNNGAAKDGPGYRGTNHNESDCSDTFEHVRSLHELRTSSPPQTHSPGFNSFCQVLCITKFDGDSWRVRTAALFLRRPPLEFYLRSNLSAGACDRSVLAARYPQRRGFRDQS